MFGEEYALKMHILNFWEFRYQVFQRLFIVFLLWNILIVIFFYLQLYDGSFLSLTLNLIFFISIGPLYFAFHMQETKLRMIACMVTSHQNWIIQGMTQGQIPDILIRYGVDDYSITYRQPSEWVKMNNTSVFETLFFITSLEILRFFIFPHWLEFIYFFPIYGSYYFFVCYFCFAWNTLCLLAFDQKNTIPNCLLDQFMN